MDQVVADFGFESIAINVQSVPREIQVMTACTGTGMCELAASALIAELNQRFIARPTFDLTKGSQPQSDSFTKSYILQVSGRLNSGSAIWHLEFGMSLSKSEPGLS